MREWETQPSATGGVELAPGARVDDYLIEERLGGGGFAEVFAARHTKLDRRVALKVLRAEIGGSRRAIERFEREAWAANRVRHPNVVDVIGYGYLADGRPYLVMELALGLPLDLVLRRVGRISVSNALHLFDQLAGGVEAVHAAGLVHRDVKPANVVVSLGPAGLSPKLVDFGVAKSTLERGPRLTRVGEKVGTPVSMSPEQIRGEPVDARTDIYSLGVLLYRLLAGCPVFSAPDADAVERMHLEVEPTPPSAHTPPVRPFDAIVLRCLAKRVEQRYADVASLRAALAAVSGFIPRRPSATSARGATASGRGTSDRDPPREPRR